MPERKDFIAIFKAETEDHLTKLDRGLVKLEKHPGDFELLNELNREAHTLKGSSRIFGYHEIQDIAHRIEDIFAKVSQKQMAFTPSVADTIFKGIDTIRFILGKIAKEERIDVDISDICRELEDCLSMKPQQTGVSRTLDTRDSQKGVNKVKEAAALEAQREGAARQDSAKDSTDEGAHKAPAVAIEEYIHVPVGRVNKLLNLVGEIVINKMKSSHRLIKVKRISNFAKEAQKALIELGERMRRDSSFGDGQEIIKLVSQCNAYVQRIREGSLELYDNISLEALHLDPVIDELQSKTKEIRMLPCATIFEGFPRMVRDIATQERKEINFEISGEETELDKKVLEGIKTPLMHILRNCIDHGIEEPNVRIALKKPPYGTIKLSAFHEAGNVVITVEDDGMGIDTEEIKRTALSKKLVSSEELNKMEEKEILNIIFTNGYSTSAIITDVSGRGVGLDVSRREIENLKGQIIIDTQKDRGTKFTMVLPLTIAIIQALLVRAQGMPFAIPMSSIAESINIDAQGLSTLEGKMAIQVHEHTVPVVKLKEVLGLPAAGIEEVELAKDKTSNTKMHLVIAISLDKRVGFIVDEIIGEEEIFIKSLGGHLGKVNNVSGATILGTGEVVVILDVADLIANSRLSHPMAVTKRAAPKEKQREKRILIAEDALSTRELEKSILQAHGYLVDTAMDGLDALDKLTQRHYDIIITDIMMPRMNGFEFCRTIKKSQEHSHIPVVIVTSTEKEEDKRRGIEVGAQAYIVKKSFDQANLLDTVERLIG